MNCLDCHDHRRVAVPAVAVCPGCGAAACRDHAAVRPRPVHRVGAMGRLDPVQPSARLVLCLTCDTAEQATTALPAEPLRLGRRRRTTAPEDPGTR